MWILPEMLPDLSDDKVAISHLCKDVKRGINQVCVMTEGPKNVFMGNVKKCKCCTELTPPIYMSL